MSHETTNLRIKMHEHMDRKEDLMDQLIQMVEQMDKKLDEKDFEIQVLNKRLFKVESEIERLTRP